ncbi:MAG TPA: hypothetical protein VF571_00920 [Pyrinomonadaceae bacterium]
MSNHLRTKFAALILLFVFLWLSTIPFSFAQTTCSNPGSLGRTSAWRQGAQISVNISGLPSNLQSCMLTLPAKTLKSTAGEKSHSFRSPVVSVSAI